jgi:prepilin-type N-terminal cleavage/methylation domain-containing protein
MEHQQKPNRTLLVNSMNIKSLKKFTVLLNRNEGFSLIEVIMVMVMAGVITAIALPRLTGFSDVDVYSAARQVKADMRYTQELAINNFRETKITFGTDTNTYAITVVDPIIHSSVPDLNRKLPPGSKATFNAVGSGTTGLIYTFNSHGEPDSTNGAADTLRISTPGGSYEDIKVTAMTGSAEIQ